jgi:RNA polymerase sigma factor (sigma-70 family)
MAGEDSIYQRLSRIDTRWSLVSDAHRGDEQAGDAQMRLLVRYSGAISRYLRGALRDADAAEELEQEFAFRFIRGDFKAVNPTRGRFRDYLRTVLSNMVAGYFQRRQQQPRQLAEDAPEPPDPGPQPWQIEEDFLAVWRRELIQRTWDGMRQLQQDTGQPYFDLLDLRVADPDSETTSAQIAEQFTATFGRRFTPENIRKLLQRAREKFADLLLEEVRTSLGDPSERDLVRELRELGLMSACRAALQRRRK